MPARTTFLLYLTLICLGMGQTIVFAILPMLGREMGLDKLLIAVPLLGIDYRPGELAITNLTSLTSLAFFIAAPLWGRRSDSTGRKPMIVIGLVGYSLGTYVFCTVGWLGLSGLLQGVLLYVLFVLSRVMLASIMCAAQPAANAYVVDSVSLDQRTGSLSRLNASMQIGTMIGPAFAAFVVFGFLAPLLVQATLTLLVLLAVLRYLPESPLQPHHRDQARPVLRYLDPRYRRFLLVGLVASTVFGMVQMTLGFYFEDHLGLDREAAALRFSMALVLSSSAMLVAQMFLVQRWPGHPVHLLHFGLPFLALGYLLIALASANPMLLAGMAAFGFGMGLTMPGFSVTATFAVTAAEQGALAGLVAASSAMGFVLGPLLGGLIYGVSAQLTYWLAAGLILLLWCYTLTLKAPSPQQ